MKKIFFILIALSLLMSACSSSTPTEEVAPPITVEDIESTAISMAWTMAAQTEAAKPTLTFTPLPPTATFTPMFTETPIFTATPLFTSTPLPSATSEGIKMLTGWDGNATTLLIMNDTKETATVSLYLSEGTNPRGYYGYITVPVLEKFGSYSVSVPMKGYYSVYAWMTGNNRNYTANGGLTTNNPDKHEIHLTDHGIIIKGP